MIVALTMLVARTALKKHKMFSAKITPAGATRRTVATLNRSRRTTQIAPSTTEAIHSRHIETDNPERSADLPMVPPDAHRRVARHTAGAPRALRWWGCTALVVLADVVALAALVDVAALVALVALADVAALVALAALADVVPADGTTAVTHEAYGGATSRRPLDSMAEPVCCPSRRTPWPRSLVA